MLHGEETTIRNYLHPRKQVHFTTLIKKSGSASLYFSVGVYWTHYNCKRDSSTL